MCVPVGRRLVAQPPNGSRRFASYSTVTVTVTVRRAVAWSLDDTCKTTRARVLPAVPVQTLVLTTGPPAVRPSLRSTTRSKYTTVVLYYFLFAYHRPQHTGLDSASRDYAYADTTTRSLAGAAAKSKPALSSSQVMHRALAPSLCTLAFTSGDRVFSIEQSIPQ
jgi:hypothetical protein